MVADLRMEVLGTSYEGGPPAQHFRINEFRNQIEDNGHTCADLTLWNIAHLFYIIFIL